jgi:hypothetical protein
MANPIAEAAEKLEEARGAVADAARDLVDGAVRLPGGGFRVDEEELVELRACLRAWTEATNAFLAAVCARAPQPPEAA